MMVHMQANGMRTHMDDMAQRPTLCRCEPAPSDKPTMSGLAPLRTEPSRTIPHNAPCAHTHTLANSPMRLQPAEKTTHATTYLKLQPAWELTSANARSPAAEREDTCIAQRTLHGAMSREEPRGPQAGAEATASVAPRVPYTHRAPQPCHKTDAPQASLMRHTL